MNVVLRERFSAALENEFVSDFDHRNTGHHRKAIFAIFLVSLASGTLNLFVPPPLRVQLLRIHYLILCPALLLIYWLSFGPLYERWSQQIMSFGVLAFASVYLLFETLVPTRPHSEASRTTLVLILVLLGAGVALKLRRPFILGICGAMFGLFSLLTATVFRLPSPVWNVLALLAACVIAVLGSEYMERGARSDFLLLRHLELLAEARLKAARAAEHEIKNKLTAISTPLRVAERGLAEDVGATRMRACLGDALQGVKALECVLHTMLNVERMLDGHEPILEAPEIAGLDSVVRAICQYRNAELRDRALVEGLGAEPEAFPEIRFESDSAMPATLLHRYSLQLAVENLLENAIKYSVREGTIRVRVWEAAEELYVSIADEGIGIEPERLDGLFAAPYRRGPAGANGIVGMGIGLSVVRMLVESLAGRVWADSGGLGQGATFTLALPRTSPRADSGITDYAMAAYPAGGGGANSVLSAAPNAM